MQYKNGLTPQQQTKRVLQQDDFLVVRLVLDEGVSQDVFDNDMILLSKDDPNVSAHACHGTAGCQQQTVQCVLCQWSATGFEIIELFRK